MASLNKVMIIGNLGRDPEVRQAGSAPVANFSVAVTEKYKPRGEEAQERTEWVNVVAWHKLADVAKDYLHKGSSVYVEGKLQTRKWQDKNGNDRYTTEVVASSIQMLDKRSEGSGYSSGGASYGNAAAARRTASAMPSRSDYEEPAPSSFTDVLGDEPLPF